MTEKNDRNKNDRKNRRKLKNTREINLVRDRIDLVRDRIDLVRDRTELVRSIRACSIEFYVLFLVRTRAGHILGHRFSAVLNSNSFYMLILDS